jgi:hypothetical protein
MNLAIDPDVFTASFFELPCQYALNLLSTEASSHKFHRDQEGLLELEYRRIFNEKCRDDALVEHPAVKLLQQILVEDGNPEDNLSSVHTVVKELLPLCPEPVEPELLGMLANASRLGLTLILVGHDAPYVRPRGLHKEDVLWKASRRIPWLDIIKAGETSVALKRVKYTEYGGNGGVIDTPPEIKAKEDAFDTKVAVWLQDKDPSFRCTTPPSKKQCGEQIDVFGYSSTEDVQTAVIGECKLRRRGNELKLIECREIQQLLRKLEAARRFISKHPPRLSHSAQLKFDGILVSNALGIDEWAKELILSEREFNIRVLLVSLNSDWETSQQWGIVNGEWLNVAQNS